MKQLIQGMTIIIALFMFAGPAAADLVFYQINEEADQTYYSANGGEVIIDGAFVTPSSLTLEKSFSGWGDLGGYADLTATLTFTWHDDTNLYTYSYSIGWYMRTDQSTDPTDPAGSWGNDGSYDDIAIVSLDGTEIFSDVEVGEAGSTDPTVHDYLLTDLSVLDDGLLTYSITAGQANLGSSYDFIVDSVALTIEGTPVPLPAAVWLLGSGLLSLIGMRRGKR
jgi:hypothetical protein